MMDKPGEFNTQLADLAAKLTGLVAERLAHWSRDMDPGERRRILEMIEGQLPDVIANTVAKSPSLHSANGVKYMEANLENWADAWAKRFIGQ